MPIYEWKCDQCDFSETVLSSIEARNVAPAHFHPLCRSMGGHGLLYFEESRGRVHIALSDKPITSKAQHERLMRINGVVECRNTVPKSVRSNPKSIAMKRFVESDKKGRWI